MIQEDKELLLKDLCARLPYGVKVHCEWNLFRGNRISEDGELVSINTCADSIHFKRDSGRITEIPFNRMDGTVLPYLRPMSSITEEEEKEYKNCYQSDDTTTATLLVDFYNKKHLDYRSLIPMGLALEAPEGMYN